MRNKKLQLLVFLVALSGNLFATTYYVNPTTGDDADDGLSSVNAKATLQDVYDSYNLAAGDIINCETGTYSETAVNPGSDDEGFTIDGEGEGNTIFDGSNGDGWNFWNSGNDDITIKDLTLRDYTDSYGGAWETDEIITGLVFTNVTFDDCDATTNAGVWDYSDDGVAFTATSCTFLNCNGDNGPITWASNAATVTLTSCVFHTNDASSGSLMYIYESSGAGHNWTFSKCTFYNNTTTSTYGALFAIEDGTFTIENCLMYENTDAGEPMVLMFSGGTLNVRNSTIVDNTGAGLDDGNSGLTMNVYSCIVQDNASTDITTTNTTNVYHTIYNTKSGTFDTDTNNETADATFKDAANDDYRITNTSNGVDEGYATGAPADDLNDFTRSGSVDMGAFETGSFVLPVQLIDYTISCNERLVKLEWSTASEIDNDYFLIERSKDGLEFEVIGTVIGQGSTSLISEYGFTDVQASDYTYYRVSQIDFNGTIETFGILAKSCSDKSTEKQEPTIRFEGDEITVRLLVGGATDYQLTVVNINGQVVYTTRGSEANTINETFSLQDQANAVYFVRLDTDQGSFSQKFVRP